jgi:hypothetical protein
MPDAGAQVRLSGRPRDIAYRQHDVYGRLVRPWLLSASAAALSLAACSAGAGCGSTPNCPELLFNSDRDRADPNAPHAAVDQEIFLSADNCDRRALTSNAATDVDPSWSPDARQIVFVSERDGNPEIYTMNNDGSAPRRLTIGPAVDKDPAWSPNGDRIAFASDRGGGGFDVFVMTLTGNGFHSIVPDRLTGGPSSETNPSWSPDGTRIAFVSDRDGNEEIYSSNLDGVYATRLTNSPNRDFAPEWSPDGKEILFIRGAANAAAHVAVMNPDGSGVRDLPVEALDSVTWSPDGARFAYTRQSAQDIEIGWKTAAGGDLSGPWGMAPSIEGNPHWRPDGGLGCRPRVSEFGADKFPAACWRPYADDSPFNTALPKSPRLVGNSAQIVQRILGDISVTNKPANLLANDAGLVGEPTVYTRSGAGYPLLTLDCVEFGGACTIDGRQVPVPPGIRIEAGAAADPTVPLYDRPDAHLTVVDANAGVEYDLWQVYTSPTPATDGTLAFSFGGQTRLDGNGTNAEPPTGNATAAHFGNLAGRLRAEELAAGTINHGLFVVLDCDNGSSVFPARGKGTACASTTDAPPMGSRLWLEMTDEQIAALDPVRFPAWKKAILYAAANYGLFFGDTGTNFYFTIEQEAGSQYVDAGQTDRWLDFAKATGWGYYAPDKNYVGDLNGADPQNGETSGLACASSTHASAHAPADRSLLNSSASPGPTLVGSQGGNQLIEPAAVHPELAEENPPVVASLDSNDNVRPAPI